MRVRSSRLVVSSLSALLAVACNTGGAVLDDRDAGADAGPLPADGGHDAPIFVDAGPDAGHDGGLDAGSCRSMAPTPPSDPLAGDWVHRYANPGVGGDLPEVEAFAFGAADRVYVGGDFAAVGYVPASNVASWDGALGWAPLGVGLPGRVHALAVDGTGRLFAAHASAGEYEPTHIARWDGTTWTNVADSTGAIQALAFVGTTLYAGGGFTRIGGVDVAGIARFDGTTWTGWAGIAPDANVEAISAVSASDVCIGGQFTTLGSVDARSAACWDGTSWHARSLPLESYRGVFALARQPSDGALFAAGDFMLHDPISGSGGNEGGSIARWSTDHWELIGGGVMSELGAGSTKEVRGLGFSGDELFIAGAFVLVDPASPRQVDAVAHWDGTSWQGMGGLFAEVGFGLDTTNALALAVGPDGSVYFGGLFTRAGSLRVAHVVRWDGTYFSALRTPGERYEGVGGTVNALAREGTCGIYVGGTFEYAGEIRANGIARYTSASGYEALGHGVSGTVLDIAVPGDGNVVVGGAFIDPDSGTLFSNVAYWDGASWRGFGAGLDGTVNAVAVPARDVDQPLVVYAAGSMTTSGATPIHALGRWDGTQWIDLGAGILGHPYESDPTMRADAFLDDVVIDPATGDVIVAGSFASIGTGADAVEANNVARWDGTHWHAYADGLGSGTAAVQTLGFFGGALIASGWFHLGTNVTPIARWNGTAWEPLASGGPDAIVIDTLEPVGSGLFVGGIFDLAGASAHVAYYDGTMWSGLRQGLSDVANALVSTEEGLYVGGGFDRAGTSAAVGLALYSYVD